MYMQFNHTIIAMGGIDQYSSKEWINLNHHHSWNIISSVEKCKLHYCIAVKILFNLVMWSSTANAIKICLLVLIANKHTYVYMWLQNI